MARTRVYLDVCCLNRPADDLSIGRNRLEAEAILSIVAQADREWDLVGSDAVQYEVRQCSDPVRRTAALELASSASSTVVAGQAEYARAAELIRLGIGDLDALHVACAEAGGCDVMLTTDDRLLRRASRHQAQLQVRLENPVAWLMEQTP